MSTTHRDRHGHIMTKEALEKMAVSINRPDIRLRMGIEHRQDFPPKGRLENASLSEKDDHFYLEADFVEYETIEPVEWDKTLRMESFPDRFQFAEVSNDETDKISIAIDPSNFTSFREVVALKKRITTEDESVALNLHGRKSLIPDPEVIFTFTKSFLLYHLLKPTIKKIGEGISEQLSEKILKEGQSATKLITKTIKEIFFKCIPKARPVSVVFEVPGKPHVELIARTRDEKLVIKGLSKKSIEQMQSQIDQMSKRVVIAKIQFLLTPKGKWKFNYLITDTGSTIGTIESFSRRDKKIQMMGKSKRKNNRR